MSHRFHMAISNQPADYPRLAEAVRAFAGEAGLAEADAVHLELVLEELAVNTINYGYPDGRAGEIVVDALVDAGLTLTLADDGDPFDPLAASPPDLELDVDSRPIGGLGIHFVRSFMDEVRYERRDGRNVVILRKQLAR